MVSNIDGVKLIETARFTDHRGSLSFVEAEEMIPFQVKRLFWIYDVKPGMSRGGHAHKKCKQAIMAIAGKFDIFITDLKHEMKLSMEKPNQIIIIPEGVWCELQNFSADAVALVATSHHFDKDDYLQPMSEYREWLALSLSKGLRSCNL